MNRVDEYKSLRDEILKDQDRQLTMVNFSLAAVSALLTFAANYGKEPLLFLMPLAILFVLLSQTSNLLRSTIIKATYIREVIERYNPTVLGWETWLHKYRGTMRPRGRLKGYLLIDAVYYSILPSLLGFACIVCGIKSLKLSGPQALQLKCGLLVLALLVWIWVCGKITRDMWKVLDGTFESEVKKTISTYQAIITAFAEIKTRISQDAELARIYMLGKESRDKINDTEFVRFDELMCSFFNLYEDLHYQYKNKLLKEELWAVWCINMRNDLAQPGVMAWWKLKSDLYNKNFSEYVNSGKCPRN
ncbi:hypothetical protein [Floridanema evergladense]|uniref:Uncharacterized protein n=1 Tax=Floridaenema evergladense BLCC-F167 TaxID=3153639 RepID=A0ABV4WTA5_9CYAN